jgi:DNA-binding CsgD family transcriptional regulator
LPIVSLFRIAPCYPRFEGSPRDLRGRWHHCAVDLDTGEALRRGQEALQAGDWEGARGSFEEALEGPPSPEAWAGRGRARWWLREVDGAILDIEQAYAGFRSQGDAARAAREALWLSREYGAVHGNAAAANGWLARAEGLLRDRSPGPEHGWLALVRAERANTLGDMRRHAEEALQLGRDLGKGDLETAALARLGYAEVAAGDVETGTTKLDEAMAAATGGDVVDLETIGDITCVAVGAFELAADWGRIGQWGQVVDAWVRAHDDVTVLAFCSTCCAEVFVASADWERAEGMLTEAHRALQSAGHRSRCVHPAAKLAELRVMEGRLEEAEALLADHEHLPEAAHALASLHVARGDTALAAALVHRRLNAVGEESVLAAPFLELLVEVQLDQGDLAGAADTVGRLAGVADRSAIPRIRAAADLARGRMGAAAGDPEAVGHLEWALSRFANLAMPLQAARARLGLARALRSEAEVAIREARRAQAELERLGAVREADAAAALLRDLGVAGRTGPKGLGLLTRREVEVVRLLGEGLTNAEIAARLYISTKTVGHHVSNVLAKLGASTRGEAGAWAIRNLSLAPAQERTPK